MAKKPVAKPSPKSAAGKGVKGGQAPNFNEALDGLDDAWNDSREKAPTKGSGGFANKNVVDGDYFARLTGAKVGISKKKKIPYIKFTLTIVRGVLKGETVNVSTNIDSETVGDSGKTHLDIISGNLQVLGIDTKKVKSTKQFPELCTFLMDPKANKRAKPFCTITVKNNMVPAEDGGETRHFQNVYINDPVMEDDLPEDK